MLPPMIGRLEKTVLDCPDPRMLAAFYAQVLGMQVSEDEEDWVVLGRVPGARELAFQRVATWVPPRWPDPHFPQPLHLDIRVDDVDALSAWCSSWASATVASPLSARRVS